MHDLLSIGFHTCCRYAGFPQNLLLFSVVRDQISDEMVFFSSFFVVVRDQTGFVAGFVVGDQTVCFTNT